MNINLLPKKNIRNVAPFYSLLVVGGIILISSIFIIFSYVKTNSEVNKGNQILQQNKLMLAEAQKEISEIRKSQALDMQDELLRMKKETVFFHPIVHEINIKVEANNSVMTKLHVELLKDDQENLPVSQDEYKSLLTLPENHVLIDLVADSDSLEKVGSCVDKVEEIQWVEEAHFINFNVERKENAGKVAKANYGLDVNLNKLQNKGE